MSNQTIGLLVIVAGFVLGVLGVTIWLGGFSWFGHLPGDIRIERESFRVDVPITSMLVLSAVLSLLVYVVRRML